MASKVLAPPPPSWGDLGREAAALGLAAHARGSRPDAAYGTAGFRMAADGLDHIMFRMGILAALRSKSLGGQAVGVMLTASHNPVRDNGVKLVEPMGEMLPISWEAHATRLANARDDGLAGCIVELATAVGADAGVRAEVIVGRDTRPSSAALAIAVCDGVGALRPGAARSLGVTTTPQLHYVVRCQATATCGDRAYGLPSLPGYSDKLVEAYSKLIAPSPGLAPTTSPTRYAPCVVLDCANGVGAVAMRPLLPRLRDLGLDVHLANDGDGDLNSGCGADFVKLTQSQPCGMDTSSVRGVSFDGDADRIVYFFGGGGESFKLLDGDRIALLLAHFCADLLQKAGLRDSLRLGLVQTAYANGASTARAVEALGSEAVLCAKTGVKHCHHAATSLDVGIYFEANGHGTAIFSDSFVAAVEGVAASGAKEASAAAKRLLLLRDVINEAVGDSVSIFLTVEGVLRLFGWSCDDWLSMYTDLPYRQVKVVVANRAAFETTDSERRCVRPEGLQAEIDRLVAAAGPGGRAFVRPSGTEDIVRVYAEASTERAMLALAQGVVDLVYDRAGGVGERPAVA